MSSLVRKAPAQRQESRVLCAKRQSLLSCRWAGAVCNEDQHRRPDRARQRVRRRTSPETKAGREQHLTKTKPVESGAKKCPQRVDSNYHSEGAGREETAEKKRVSVPEAWARKGLVLHEIAAGMFGPLLTAGSN